MSTLSAEPTTALATHAALWLFITVSAAFYVGAMVAMKHWGALPMPMMAATIALCMVLAAVFETLALRGERLGMVYAAILGVEVVMLALVATLILGETFTAREVGGVALIVVGTALAWS